MNKHIICTALLLVGLCQSLSAQDPWPTADVQTAYNEMVAKEQAASDAAWEVALPIVLKEAEEGRPYVPWASRPSDLPQAKIPAFPGAEGGGMYTPGGRGGKVLTVTNLNDPTDANGDCTGDGYTNIEKYINGISTKVKVDWRNLNNNYDTLAEKGRLVE